MERLTIHDCEELEFVDEGEGEVEARQTLSLVGRFLTIRNISVPIMKDRMADVWRPGHGVQIARFVCFLVLSSVKYTKGVKEWSLAF